ncbi:TIM-barrel domain-containing protein [Enterococcus entomosocium]|uniref:TIM-barrel domain-containing protein n=1 Tax=Enterococcus entomosocium TaxID=3034352 RepID=A0ABV3MHB1_9ENTE|nr:glycoside hydrolase family 31 protein [Enterococcus casseliflavus]
MKLEQTFSEVLEQYNDLLNSSVNTNAIYNLNTELDNLPVAAAIVWLKVKSNIELGEDDYVVINAIQSKWSMEYSNVFEEDEDIYTSNLAIFYITLSEVKNAYQLYDLQKSLTDIRDYVFNHMIREGSLISSLKKNNPDYDLVLSVLPFGLFAPEDLIMVSGMNKLLSYNKSIDPNTAALLGIYFTEKYDFVRADSYLNQAENHSSEDTVLIKILETYLQQKKENISTSVFIHKPLGNSNVYNQLPYERAPHYPTVKEKCVFNVQVNASDIQEVFMHLEGIAEKFPCRLVDETLRIYQAVVEIPANYQGGNYFFTLISEKNEKSEVYELAIQKNSALNRIEFIGSNEKENIYSIKNEEESIYLLFQETKLLLSQEKPELDSIEVNKKMARIDSQNHLFVSNETLAFSLSEDFVEIHELVGKGIIGTTLRIKDKAQIYYGFGERYNSVNQLGNTIDCFVYNQYRDQGTRTYMPMPYYFTDCNYGLFINSNYYTRFDLQDSNKFEVDIYIETGENNVLAEIDLLHGDMKEMISQYIGCTGEPLMVPSWTLGPWMSSNNWDRDSVVREQIELKNKYDIPATVIVLEQWSDETTYYMFNDAQYPMLMPGEVHTYDQMNFPEWGRWPDPKALVNHCHENGLKFILWQIPIEKYLNQQNHPLKDQDEAYMIEKGFVVKNIDGSPYRIPENWFTDSLLMDFTNEEAKEWWFKKRQYLLDIGVDGFKTDGGEMVYGADVMFSDGSNGREMRNRYPKEYIKAYYEFAQQNQGITFSRSGYTGAQGYPAHWAGDERSTFDAFNRQLIAGINSGMSGVIFWGWDLAGFNGDIPTAELFMRSSSMAAFCPIMQYHAESKGEFNQDRTPWNIAERTQTPEVIDVYRFFANTRMNLMPYIYNQSLKSVNEKTPLMRAMQIEFPNEDFKNCYDEFMFGKSLLVAPVIHEGMISRKVKLPEGTWVDFWNHSVVQGGKTIHVNAEFDQIPVFIKENSAILLNLGESKTIGESIGNDLTKYTNAKLVVVAKDSFSETIEDHLGNLITIDADANNRKVSVSQKLPIEVELIWL